MNQTGTHIITDELTLTDFTWDINTILWWYDQDIIWIEVYFNDGVEARSFIYATSDTSITKQDCKDYLLTLSQFLGSTN